MWARYVTPLYSHGSADRWEQIVAGEAKAVAMQQELALRGKPPQHQRQRQRAQQQEAITAVVTARMQAATDYVESLVLLHHLAGERSGQGGSYIHCDAREGPAKLLSQYVVPPDLRLLLNDVDATPWARSIAAEAAAGGGGAAAGAAAAAPVVAKCGHLQFSAREFVAPEQLWPHTGARFNDAEMPGYDEKSDIWRVPRTVEALLGAELLAALFASEPHGPVLAAQWELLRAACAAVDPAARPDARKVALLLATFSQTAATSRSNDLDLDF